MLGGRIGIGRITLMIATTEIAVPATRMGVNTFHRRGSQHALGSAEAALGTLRGIDLPDIVITPRPCRRPDPRGSNGGTSRAA